MFRVVLKNYRVRYECILCWSDFPYRHEVEHHRRWNCKGRGGRPRL